MKLLQMVSWAKIEGAPTLVMGFLYLLDSVIELAPQNLGLKLPLIGVQYAHVVDHQQQARCLQPKTFGTRSKRHRNNQLH